MITCLCRCWSGAAHEPGRYDGRTPATQTVPACFAAATTATTTAPENADATTSATTATTTSVLAQSVQW